MNEIEIKQVTFHDEELLVIKDFKIGKVYVPIKIVCQTLGFTNGQCHHQNQKVKDDEVLKKGVREIIYPTMGGIQQLLSIDVEFLPLWMAKINPKTVKNGKAKRKLIEYQLRAKDVLMSAFLPRYKMVNNIIDHSDRNIQIQNSKDINSYNYNLGGMEKVKDYNRASCIVHTGERPSYWKDKAKELGLKSKHRKSGKEAVRNLHPEMACAMSFTDNLVKEGHDLMKISEISKKFALPLFEKMIESGITPQEIGDNSDK